MRIADYQVGELLGKGRFGEVRLVTHLESGMRYACKTAEGDTHRKMLRREAVMQREITSGSREQWDGVHSIFPAFRELMEGENQTFLVMEYVEGTPLSGRLHEKRSNAMTPEQGELSEAELFSVAVQLAEGLKVLHERLAPVLYRDLKPEHVILCGGDHVRLLDLGCACRQSEAWKSKAGSRGYAAPEQLNEDTYGQGVYSDIYSFGKLLEAMGAGGQPNGDWRRLTAWCTAENPADRIPCMRLVLRELRRMQQGRRKAQLHKREAQPEWMHFRVEKCICSQGVYVVTDYADK